VFTTAELSDPHHDIKDVVIIGGRACGTAAVVNLVESLEPGSRITVVDPQDPEYPSVFHDADSQLLVNTSHSLNSVFPDRPADFLEFLDEADRTRSVPRHVVGKYCRTRLQQAREVALRRGVELVHVVGNVRWATATSEGYDLLLDSGRHLRATDIVIAVGVGEVPPPQGITGIPPYPASRLRRMAGRNALVIGQGQSGLDAALVLCSAGAHVTLCSRTGRFPAVRTRTHFHPYQGPRLVEGTADFRRLVDEDCRRRGYPALSEQLAPASDPISMLREETRLAEQELCPWQDAIVGIIVAMIDAGVSPVDDKEFLWRYVTAINLPIAQQLLAQIDDGRIAVKTIDAVDPKAFDLVVTATGVSPPPVYHQGRTLYFGNGFPEQARVKRLTKDLRLVLSDSHQPERIWAIGPASGIRVPFANFLHTAARQAALVARQISRTRALA
jgi:hypothetical protein